MNSVINTMSPANTIEKAYKILRKEGYIISVPGNGYYVYGKKIRS